MEDAVGPPKRYRRDDPDDDENVALPLGDDQDNEEEQFEEYIPVKKRRQMEEQKRLERLGRAPATIVVDNGDTSGGPTSAAGDHQPSSDHQQQQHPADKQSLLVMKAKAIQEGHVETEEERKKREEQDIMRNIQQTKALKTYHELAKGVDHRKAINTGWKPPLKYRLLMTEEDHNKTREAFFIKTLGNNIPPAMTSYADILSGCRHRPALLKHLESQGILKPTPIQMQGLPAIFSGRDMIGIAFTGSGKTMVFTLPMILVALQEEVRMPLQRAEGPLGLVVCPSRELAKQTHEVLQGFIKILKDDGAPELRSMLCIGGMDSREQGDLVRNSGVHLVVATPGRLKDLLHRRRMTLDICRYFCLDEADRMIASHQGFEEEIREIMSYLKGQRQMVMFSATMPSQIRTFAESALNDPVEVNVSRAGASNLDIIQEIDYVKEEDKLVHLLDVLQKTAPPVLIFAENKRDVDAIHEFLLVKSVEAVAVHGSKDQEERDWAVAEFKAGRKDVLIATDVASKGLDFPGIQHVINYDMPGEIENYIHRIGRTGRRGKTGVATTFINKNTPEITLLDLKGVLKEAKQRIPPMLAALDDPFEEAEAAQAAAEASGQRGCVHCGGLGHRVSDCPKLKAETRAKMGASRDFLGGGGFSAEM